MAKGQKSVSIKNRGEIHGFLLFLRIIKNYK